MATDEMTRRRFVTSSAAVFGSGAFHGNIMTTSAENETRAGAPLLRGKIVLVTGAARGIGRAVALACAEAGAAVALLDIADPTAYRSAVGYSVATVQDLDQAVDATRKHGGAVHRIVADVRRLDQLQQATQSAVATLGGLDIVVANAGYVAWSAFDTATPEQWREVIDTNVHGVWNTMQASIPHLRRRGGGRIIAMSSIGGRLGVAGNGAYTCSKWAVIGMVKQAAIELGKYGIAVNAVAPGPVDTPMYRSEGQRRSTGVSSAAEQDAQVRPMLPLGTRGVLSPEEVADTVVFLSSELARGVSGVSLDVAHGFNASYTA